MLKSLLDFGTKYVSHRETLVASEKRSKINTRCNKFPKFSTNPEHVGMVSKCSEKYEDFEKHQEANKKENIIIVFHKLSESSRYFQKFREHM